MKLSTITISLALLALASGCISVGMTPRERNPAYIVDSIRPADRPPAKTPMNTALRLRKFHAAEPFDSRRIFVLNDKTGEIKPLTSGTFAVTAAVAASDVSRRWLTASGLFSDVGDQAVMPPGNAVNLDGWIDQVCVLDTEAGYQFSLKMTLWLTPANSLSESVPQRFDFAETYPITELNPAEIATAFGETLKQTLLQLETALQQ